MCTRVVFASATKPCDIDARPQKRLGLTCISGFFGHLSPDPTECARSVGGVSQQRLKTLHQIKLLKMWTSLRDFGGEFCNLASEMRSPDKGAAWPASFVAGLANDSQGTCGLGIFSSSFWAKDATRVRVLEKVY